MEAWAPLTLRVRVAVAVAVGLTVLDLPVAPAVPAS